MNRKDGLKVLADYRNQIDEIDRRLVQLLNERTRIVEKLGRVKQELRMPIYEPRREDEVFQNVADSNEGPLPSDALKRLFERIVDEMRTLQRMKRETRGDQLAAGEAASSTKGS
ncbi:MAG: chorismate mutase [Bryobacteraceae bacterium]|nr:chorismate mutase [Bryobacteraceae bacterium]